MEKQGHLKRLHECSRATRYRRRVRMRRGQANDRHRETSSSDDEPRPLRRNLNLNPRQPPDPDPSSPSSSSNSGEEAEGSASSANDERAEEITDGDETRSEQEGDNDAHSIQSERSEGSNRPESDEGDQEDRRESSNGSVTEEDRNSGEDDGSDVNESVDGSDLEQERGEEYGWDQNDNEQLYELAPITLGESMLAILTFYLRHNLSLVCLSDLLNLIDLHCRQQRNLLPKTLFHFRKFFHNIQFPIVRHYYCSVCHQIVAHEGDECENCERGRGNQFFIEIPLITQLKALYQRPDFREKLNHRVTRRKFADGALEDIYDGTIYKELSENGGILSNVSNISFMWYSDGVSIFKSSRYEIWPFYLAVNELPYNDRTNISNAILAGLWFGKGKPEPSTFLQPLREDILRLREGINIQHSNPVQTIRVRGIILSGTADIPAKTLFLNFKNHKGTFGCSKCTIESRVIRRGLNVFPYQQDLDLRTDAQTLRYAREALELPLFNGYRQDIYGVKGPTILSTMVFQCVRTTAVDGMHFLFLGILKSQMQLWFDSSFKDENFSLYQHTMLVNNRLASISPPNFVQRLSRTLDDVKYWKAHELKTFLFYYSIPVLADIMTDVYLEHHLLLVFGMYLLHQRSISENMITLASELLSEYVSQFEYLYGIEHMSCNLHQLLHAPKVVKELGPLWVTSCFPFEDLNGKLKKLVKGTRYAELQICSGVSMLMKLSELKQNIPQNCRALIFSNKIYDNNWRFKLKEIGNSLAIVGKYEHKNTMPPLVLEALNRSNVNGRNFYEFYRLKKYSIMYVAELYRRAVKTKSYCVKYKHGIEEGIGFIDRFIRVTDCACVNFCDGCDPKYFAIIRKCVTRIDFSPWDGAGLKFLHTLIEATTVIAIDVSNLIVLCFVVNITDKNVTYLVEPVNMIEAE